MAKVDDVNDLLRLLWWHDETALLKINLLLFKLGSIDNSFLRSIAYLMASAKNAERLNQAMTEIKAGESKEHGIIEEWSYPGQHMHGIITFTGKKRRKKPFKE